MMAGSNATAANDPAVHDHELMTLRYGFAGVLTADATRRALEAGGL